ncbi:ArsR/SmtB family transcription factor [Allomesorhizobium camelthorni]|uniref:Winged helix-turn-helix transcriptional regulator n=1 Tax=Allomesorhizobium camelthorni TaxID=475069 RepID=A0A6G4WIG9_9HYPH|nr:metalloregulator ArsR/SmtB family transcription factor [Mesorhizobium camelthorni]NGO53993.1 winged helix-turn-helix transcriptional regulator [Mesorhizobium camelthorni]
MDVSPSSDFNECGSASAKALAAKLAALSHPARIEILKHLSGNRACCCKDVVQQLDLAQSTVSQHLKVLVEAGLVRFSAERQRSLYEIDREALAGISASVAGLVDTCCSSRPA